MERRTSRERDKKQGERQRDRVEGKREIKKKREKDGGEQAVPSYTCA